MKPNLLWIFAVLVPFLFCPLSQAATAPDFGVGSYFEPSSKTWGIVLTPPAAHHFNIKAPMGVSGLKAEEFKITEKEEPRIIFESTASDWKEGRELEVNAFLCDDAKTYCVKKTAKLLLKADGKKPVKKKSIKNQSR